MNHTNILYGKIDNNISMEHHINELHGMAADYLPLLTSQIPKQEHPLIEIHISNPAGIIQTVKWSIYTTIQEAIDRASSIICPSSNVEWGLCYGLSNGSMVHFLNGVRNLMYPIFNLAQSWEPIGEVWNRLSTCFPAKRTHFVLAPCRSYPLVISFTPESRLAAEKAGMHLKQDGFSFAILAHLQLTQSEAHSLLKKETAKWAGIHMTHKPIGIIENGHWMVTGFLRTRQDHTLIRIHVTNIDGRMCTVPVSVNTLQGEVSDYLCANMGYAYSYGYFQLMDSSIFHSNKAPWLTLLESKSSLSFMTQTTVIGDPMRPSLTYTSSLPELFENLKHEISSIPFDETILSMDTKEAIDYLFWLSDQLGRLNFLYHMCQIGA